MGVCKKSGQWVTEFKARLQVEESEAAYVFELRPALQLRRPRSRLVAEALSRATLTLCSEAFAPMYGATHRREMYGRSLADFLGPPDGPNERLCRRFFEQGLALLNEESIEHAADGSIRVFDNVLRGHASDGYLGAIAGTQQDSTEWKRPRLALQELTTPGERKRIEQQIRADLERRRRMIRRDPAFWAATPEELDKRAEAEVRASFERRVAPLAKLLAAAKD